MERKGALRKKAALFRDANCAVVLEVVYHQESTGIIGTMNPFVAHASGNSRRSIVLVGDNSSFSGLQDPPTHYVFNLSDRICFLEGPLQTSAQAGFSTLGTGTSACFGLTGAFEPGSSAPTAPPPVRSPCSSSGPADVLGRVSSHAGRAVDPGVMRGESERRGATVRGAMQFELFVAICLSRNIATGCLPPASFVCAARPTLLSTACAVAVVHGQHTPHSNGL
jgi:hypothetical protein